MKGGPKSSLRPFLHRALQLFKTTLFQYRHIRKGGALGRKFHSEMSKRGEKVQTRYVGKKECAHFA